MIEFLLKTAKTIASNKTLVQVLKFIAQSTLLYIGNKLSVSPYHVDKYDMKSMVYHHNMNNDNKKLDEVFNVLSNDDIKQCSDLQNALELINQENIITEIEAPEPKKFVVQKNSNISNLTKTSLEEKDEEELDEISDQADQAFYDLMNIDIH